MSKHEIIRFRTVLDFQLVGNHSRINGTVFRKWMRVTKKQSRCNKNQRLNSWAVSSSDKIQDVKFAWATQNLLYWSPRFLDVTIDKIKCPFV